MSKDLSKFDHGNLISLRVFLNGESFPLENLNLAIDKNRYIPLYVMYCAFQECDSQKLAQNHVLYFLP